MAFRRTPLGPKNVEYPLPKTKTQKAPRSLVPSMDRTDLLALLRKINDKHCSPEVQVSVADTDLTSPTNAAFLFQPERVELIYHMLLNVLFATVPSVMNQMPFSTAIDHPEWFDGFHYVINLLRILCHVMNAFVVPDHDFGPRDLTDPQPKRTQHFFTAIVNYIKFNQFITKECHLYEHEEKTSATSSCLHEVKRKNEEMEQLIEQLKKQRIERKKLEEEILDKIELAEKNLNDLWSLKEESEEKLKNCEMDKKQAQKNLEIVDVEFCSLQSRLEELKLQVVLSPEELNEKLSTINDELEEMRSVYEDCSSNHSMWETLSTKAANVLPPVTGIIEDVGNVIDKAHLRNEKVIVYEKIEDDALKIKQARKECLAKQQNIIRHLKLIQEENAGLGLEMKSKPNEDKKIELERDLVTLKRKVEEKSSFDSEMEKQIKEKTTLLDAVHQDYLQVLANYEKTVKISRNLCDSYSSRVEAIEKEIK